MGKYKIIKKCLKWKKKNQKNAKNRASFLPSPVPPLNKGTLNLPKIETFRGTFHGTGNVRSVAVLEYDYVILGSLAPWSLGSTGCKIFYVPSLKSSVKSVCIFLTNLSGYLSYSNLVFRFDERKLNAFFIFVIFFSRPKPVVFQQQPTSSSLGMGKASTIDKKPSFDTQSLILGPASTPIPSLDPGL